MGLEWLSLIGAIWLQAMSGTNSNFPAYSSHLKHLLKLSQLDLNNLALASDTGKLLGWISGFAAAYLPLWLVLLVGATLGFIGYGVQYLFVANQISELTYWQAFLLTFLAGNSICWINTVSYVIAIQNFPLDRQIAVGLSTSYQGLSAKIFTDIVNTVTGSSTAPADRAKAYLFLNATLPLLVCLATGPVVRNVTIGKSKKLAGGFLFMFIITIITGIYAVISSLSFVTRFVPPYVLVIGIGIFLVLPILVPFLERLREKRQKKCLIRETKVRHVSSEDNVTEISSPEILPEEEEEVEGQKPEPVKEICVREEIGPKLMLRRTEFWLYYFVYLFGVTLGLVYMNNLGQIVESRGSAKTSAFLALSSSFGFFGRLVPSVLDYYFTRYNYIVSRPASIAAMMVPMSAAFFLLLHGSNLALYVGTATIGICTGAITAITVSTTTELFGAKTFGVNHNIVVTNIPLGSFIFGDMAALLYKKYAHGNNGGCIGTKCYQTSFLIWGSLCVFGTFLAIILHLKTRKFYSQNRLSWSIFKLVHICTFFWFIVSVKSFIT